MPFNWRAQFQLRTTWLPRAWLAVSAVALAIFPLTNDSERILALIGIATLVAWGEIAIAGAERERQRAAEGVPSLISDTIIAKMRADKATGELKKRVAKLASDILTAITIATYPSLSPPGWLVGMGGSIMPAPQTPNIIYVRGPQYVDDSRAVSQYEHGFRDDVIKARDQLKGIGIFDPKLDTEIEGSKTAAIIASIGSRLGELAERLEDVG